MNERAVTLGLAVWAAAATVILLVRGWDSAPQPGELKTQQRAVTAPPTKAPARADDKPAAPEERSLERYDLCLTEGVPEVILPELEGQPLLGVHCGGSARMLRFVAGEPLLLLDVTVTISPPHAHAVPAPLLLTDIDRDGRADLLVGQRYEDSDGTPIGGSVASLHGASRGGFEPPQKLLNAFPLRLFSGRFDAEGKQSLAILHGRNPHHGYGPELWRYMPDSTPSKAVIATLPPGSRVLAQLDLDRDGRQELLVTAERQGQAGLSLFQLHVTDAADQRFLPLGHVNAVAIGDIDGDQLDDALVAGEALWTLTTQRAMDRIQPQLIPDSPCPELDGKVAACHRDPQIAKTQKGTPALLKSYRHPDLQLFVPGHKHRSLPLSGDGLNVLSTYVLDVDGDDRMDVLAVVHPSKNPRAAQLAWLSDALGAQRLRLGDHRGALPEALLHTSDGLE